MPKKKIAVLVSGGLDSDVLVADLARRAVVFPVYIRQRLAWESAELFWLRRYLKALRHSRVRPLTILDLPLTDVYGTHWSLPAGQADLSLRGVPGARTPDRAVFLPGRNLILTVKTAVFCSLHGIPELALGSLGHNPFPDATPAFFKQLARLFSRALHSRFRVTAPYRRMTKRDVIHRGKSLPLHLSFSCIAPRGRRHCGRCNKCAERRRAFRRAGVPDHAVYAR